jgi:hypothetical protein
MTTNHPSRGLADEPLKGTRLLVASDHRGRIVGQHGHLRSEDKQAASQVGTVCVLGSNRENRYCDLSIHRRPQRIPRFRHGNLVAEFLAPPELTPSSTTHSMATRRRGSRPVIAVDTEK